MTPDTSGEYELVPMDEIKELKEELRKLKEYPIPTGKRLEVTMSDLAIRMDRLITIFEEAGHQLKAEEGGLTYEEKLKPLLAKLNKVLEQNSEIAEGIVALADIVNDLKDKMEKGFVVKESREIPAGKMFEEPKPIEEIPTLPPRQPAPMGVQEIPPMPSGPEAPLPPPPVPPRRRLFV